jgi:hypothetical protein
LSIPTISGTPVVGNLLTVSGGAWQSPNPRNTATEWRWWRCDNPFAASCRSVAQREQTYRLTAEDNGRWIAATRLIRFPASADCNPASECLEPVSTAVGPVTVAATPTPAPVVTPEPTPVPAPQAPPTFDTVAPAPTPVPTQGPVLQPHGSSLRVMRPAPTVRMRGTLSVRGARVTLFSVRASKTSTITVTCQGSGCPRKKYTTRQRTARVRAFERDLPARTRIEVRVRRAGYYGKSTVFVIRRGKAPSRLDRCLSARGAYTACPESS